LEHAEALSTEYVASHGTMHLHHTLYTIHLHHTPYTIHRTPYTIHHTPYSIHHTAYTYTIHYTP